jgi:thiamine phosphate synthase YjbQ (UPF0047 family)
MKAHTTYLTFNTRKKREYLNITAEVETAVRDARIQEGMVLVSAMHITAGVFVNDNESGFLKDLDDFLERLAPEDGYYRHHQTGEHRGSPSSDPAGDEGLAGPGAVAAGVLCRVRWAAGEAAGH